MNGSETLKEKKKKKQKKKHNVSDIKVPMTPDNGWSNLLFTSLMNFFFVGGCT